MASLGPGSPQSYNLAPGESSADLDYKKKMAYAMLMQGISTEPVKAWTQGAARLAQALLGGYDLNQVQKEEDAQKAQGRAILSQLAGGDLTMPQASPPPQAPISPIAPRPPAPVQNPAQSPLAMAGQYQPLIQSAAENAGLNPDLLARQLYQENQFKPTGVSPAGARGIAQFMPGTAQQYGVNPDVPEQAIPGAAKYMADLSKKYNGNTQLALAAYNWGPGNVDKWIASGANPNAVPAETQNYVKSITGNPLAVAPQTTGTTQGAPADLARGGLTDAKRLQLTQALMLNPATSTLGQALMAKEMDRQATRWTPLLTAQDRAAHGIQPSDTNPYQANALGEVKAVNPQPFAVNVNQQAESEFSKTYGGGLGKQALEVVANGDKAASELQRVQLLKGLLGQIQTGKLTPAQATIGGWAQSMGLDPSSIGINPATPATAEAATALINKFALGNIGTAEGGIPANNFSEADRDFAVKIAPGLRNRPEANDIILAAKERENQLAMQRANDWQDARDKGISYEKFSSQWRKKLQSMNVFGDLIKKVEVLNAQPGQTAAGQTTAAPTGGVRRYNPQTGKIE